MRMPPSYGNFDGDLVIEGLDDVVLGPGPHTFRIIFNQKKYKNCHGLNVKVYDSSMRNVTSEVSRWGTKMRVSVRFDSESMEGISYVVVEGMPPDPQVDSWVARFWFVR